MTRTSISTRHLILAIAFINLISGVSGDFETNPYNQQESETGFEIPSYDSPEELIFQLAIPLFTLFVFTKLALMNGLEVILGDPDEIGGPDESRLSMTANVIAISVVSMTIPTQAWEYVRYILQAFGIIPFLAAVAVTFYVTKERLTS